MKKPKYELSYSQKYSDSHVTYIIYLGKGRGYVVEDFHSDRPALLHEYMQEEMSRLISFRRKDVEALLLKGIKEFGVGEEETVIRRKLWNDKCAASRAIWEAELRLKYKKRIKSDV